MWPMIHHTSSLSVLPGTAMELQRNKKYHKQAFWHHWIIRNWSERTLRTPAISGSPEYHRSSGSLGKCCWVASYPCYSVFFFFLYHLLGTNYALISAKSVCYLSWSKCTHHKSGGQKKIWLFSIIYLTLFLVPISKKTTKSSFCDRNSSFSWFATWFSLSNDILF